MFSSNNSATNPFSHFPSNSSCLPDLPFHGCQQDPVLIGHFLPTINAQIPDSVIAMVGSNNGTKMPYQDIVGSSSHGGRVPSFLAAKKPMKKYRHSKICTAQGLRDRRVRLSIEIAREFFDLQDMLGFDKASETLEWLFRKSRNAIKKAQMKHSCHESGSSECDEVESGAHEEDDNGGEGGSIGSKICKEKKMKKPAEFQVLAKESRSKARARARERTKEKLCSRKINESKICSDTFSNLLSQLRSSSQFEKSSSYMAASSSKVLAEIQKPIPSSHPFADFQVPRENTFEESNEIKRKLIPFSSILDYHDQNLVISKDAILNNNNNNNSFPNLPQNWDINSSIALSSFCAITNMNLSKEVQICGKPWEAQNN